LELKELELAQRAQARLAKNLPKQYQDLLATQNKRQINEILRDRVNAKVEASIERILVSRNAKA
jgi:hypothetical protein